MQIFDINMINAVVVVVAVVLVTVDCSGKVRVENQMICIVSVEFFFRIKKKIIIPDELCNSLFGSKKKSSFSTPFNCPILDHSSMRIKLMNRYVKCCKGFYIPGFVSGTILCSRKMIQNLINDNTNIQPI
jgi:hypothetical protein